MSNQLEEKKRSFLRRNKVQPSMNNPDEQPPNYPGVVAIAIMMFTIGIGLYLPGGISDPLINTFHYQGVDINTVNLSMTIYLIGLIVGAVLVPVVFLKFKRKFIIIGAAVDYIICNIIIAFSTNWGELLAFRFLAGCAHGCVTGVATLMAAYMVPKNKKGMAIALCYSALFASTFTVVPLLTYTSAFGGWGVKDNWDALAHVAIVHQYWRWDFVVVTGFSILALFMLCFCIPNSMKIPGKVDLKVAVKTLWWWPFVLYVIFDILIFFGIFVIYPLLQDVWTTSPIGFSSFSNNMVAVFLLVYGVLSLISNQLGGYFTSGRTFPWLYVVTGLFILNIIALILSCIYKQPAAVLVFTLLIPVVAYLALPNIYAVCFGLAKHHDKSDSIDFESGVVSVGIGLGAVIGTAMGGPIASYTTGPNAGNFNPNGFNIILYIVLGALILGMILLFPINWYLNSAELIIVRDNLMSRLLNKMPIYIDNYSSVNRLKLVEDNPDKIYLFEKRKTPTGQTIIDHRNWSQRKKLKNKKEI